MRLLTALIIVYIVGAAVAANVWAATASGADLDDPRPAFGVTVFWPIFALTIVIAYLFALLTYPGRRMRRRQPSPLTRNPKEAHMGMFKFAKKIVKTGFDVVQLPIEAAKDVLTGEPAFGPGYTERKLQDVADDLREAREAIDEDDD